MLLPKEDLLKRVERAVTESGWNIAYLDTPPTHPFRLALFSSHDALRVRVYMWNLTHGGGPRAAEEYRIQVTGVPDGITSEAGFRTILLGYWADADVFAGFDVSKHSGPISYSPSIQIREEALRLAHVNGFAPHTKGGGELAIAFRPDFFVEYCRHVEDLHGFGDTETDVRALEAVAEEGDTVNESDVDIAPVERRPVLRQVAEAHVTSQFRRRVLMAYGHTCAFCGMQMGLVEAAHIVPVSHPATSYETQNGVALCALHHKAFDGGLVAFDTSYRIQINEEAVALLRERNRAAGEQIFRGNLRSLIVLPATRGDRPNAALIEMGLDVRGWPSDSR